MKLSIVIPAYNEATRLPDSLTELVAFAGSSKAISLDQLELVISDDGSQDDTISVASSFADQFPHLKVVGLKENAGKGAAIRHGIQNATAEWVLVADADMATPWTEIDKFFEFLTHNPFDMLIGSRAMAESDIKTRQPFFRESMGKIFNLIIRSITGLPFRDTQCGFKLIKNTLAQKLLPLLKVDRFAWDVEFLMMARFAGAKITDRPVEWHHREASRVRPIVDSFEMLVATLNMRLNLELNRGRIKDQISHESV